MQKRLGVIYYAVCDTPFVFMMHSVFCYVEQHMDLHFWNLVTQLSLSSQVMIIITGAHKAFALYKAIEEGVNHMWTVSAFQQHPQTVFVCDEDATLELRVKTVKYFKGET